MTLNIPGILVTIELREPDNSKSKLDLFIFELVLDHHAHFVRISGPVLSLDLSVTETLNKVVVFIQESLSRCLVALELPVH